MNATSSLTHLFKPKNYSVNLQVILSSTFRNRALVFEMAKRELKDRYVGQVFGKFWIVAHPLILMGIYVFLFGVVYQTRMGSELEFPLDFTAYILSGLIPWLSVQEVMAKSCGAITNQKSLVKQILFPIEVLPIKDVLVSYVALLIGFMVLCIYVLASNQRVPLLYLALPVLLILHFLLCAGISYSFAAIGVYFRDLKDFVQVFCTIGIYLIPVVYLPNWVPKFFKPILNYNPFSHLIWCYQDVLYYGSIRHPWSWGITFVVALLFFGVGATIFNKLKPYFGSAL